MTAAIHASVSVTGIDPKNAQAVAGAVGRRLDSAVG
jgi:hypothetical protein